MKGNDMNMPGNNETAYFTGSSPVVGTTFFKQSAGLPARFSCLNLPSSKNALEIFLDPAGERPDFFTQKIREAIINGDEVCRMVQW
jgi:hypothetical protein